MAGSPTAEAEIHQPASTKSESPFPTGYEDDYADMVEPANCPLVVKQLDQAPFVLPFVREIPAVLFEAGHQGRIVARHQKAAPALVLPIAEAQAVMGETVKAYLARVAWRFELPTVLTINGEYYARAEWETRAFAANDRVEFISRPLGGGSGGGSTAKSIMSVVALVALTAVAGPSGFIGAALASSLGSVGGAIAGAAIVGAAAAPVALWMRPPVPWWRRAIRTARDSLRAVLNVACRVWSPAA